MTHVPRRLSTPPFERSLLDWWADDYDHVFIALNPFFRVPGFSPETAAYGPMHFDREDLSPEEAVDTPPQRPNEAPEDFELLIKDSGTPVTWAEVQDKLGVRDREKFRRTVWLWTLESDRADCDGLIAGGLDQLAARGLYRPEEDIMPVIMEPQIHRFLTTLGIEEVTLWNEWRDEHMTCPTECFARGEGPVTLPQSRVAAISCDSPRLLMAWTHDGVEGFICMSDDARRACPPESVFEGDYAGVATYPDWLNPPGFFDRVQPVFN